MAVTVNTDKQRAEFFESIFGAHEGYICIAAARATSRVFTETYFEWPKDIAKMMRHLNEIAGGHNVWFCAQLLETPKRVKENVGLCYALWADLDTCNPYEIVPRPPVVLQSSDDRWQALWPLTTGLEPVIAEDYSHRIAYAYKDQGADQAGWDLTQLLRVPYTFNYKYPSRPIVQMELDLETKYEPKLFRDNYDHVPFGSVNWTEAPERVLNADTVLAQYRPRLQQYMIDMYADEPSPNADWSAILWKLMSCMFEIGMNTNEVYAVATTAACNKFLRDGKPERLWPDVLRAHAAFESTRIVSPVQTLPDFELNYDILPSFVEEYADWACTLTDAPREYHEASAFIILSAILSSSLEVESSIEDTKTNLWVLILGETTLTRKTTAMKLAVRIINEIDEDILLATTEGSVEGIMDAMQLRPHRAALFYRDEVAGMFKATARRDYLSGMLEAFTKLYDGDDFKRLLRKEIINVKDPVFIFFGGGIKEATLAAMQEEHLTSGFIPRFLWVIGETTPDQLQPLGPRSPHALEIEGQITSRLRILYATYNKTQTITIGEQQVDVPLSVKAELTDKAWELYNNFHNMFVSWAHGQTQRDILLPIMSRTSINCLKMAALIAASQQDPSITGRITVSELDMAHAIKYVRSWMPHTIEVIRDAGVSSAETLLQRVLLGIQRRPGISRSELMRNYRLSAREMTAMQDTLRERMLVRVEKDGRQENHYPTD